MFTIGESRTSTISSVNATQAQQVAPNSRPGRFSTETPLERERRLQFSVNNEGEDVNKKPRSRENIAYHSEGNADHKRQRNRGTGD